MTYGFEPPDPHDDVYDVAPCDRCLRGVPNDEQHLHDGVGRWVGFYLCTACLADVEREELAAFWQMTGPDFLHRAHKWMAQGRGDLAVLHQRNAAHCYARAREIMGIDDTVNKVHN